MQHRIALVVAYATGGRRKDFAEKMGWKPQYLTKLLRGEAIGVKPLVSILEVFPEISPQWLLLGQGSMLKEERVSTLQREVRDKADALLELAGYLPKMSEAEVASYAQALSTVQVPTFSDEDRQRWQAATK